MSWLSYLRSALTISSLILSFIKTQFASLRKNNASGVYELVFQHTSFLCSLYGCFFGDPFTCRPTRGQDCTSHAHTPTNPGIAKWCISFQQCEVKTICLDPSCCTMHICTFWSENEYFSFKFWKPVSWNTKFPEFIATKSELSPHSHWDIEDWAFVWTNVFSHNVKF